MNIIDVLTQHSDAIFIAIIVAVFGAIPSTIAAIGTYLNGRSSARNGAAIADMHDCLDKQTERLIDHDNTMRSAVERADAARGTTPPDWNGEERRSGQDRRQS